MEKQQAFENPVVKMEEFLANTKRRRKELRSRINLLGLHQASFSLSTPVPFDGFGGKIRDLSLDGSVLTMTFQGEYRSKEDFVIETWDLKNARWHQVEQFIQVTEIDCEKWETKKLQILLSHNHALHPAKNKSENELENE